jgi:hypothetical protein
MASDADTNQEEAEPGANMARNWTSDAGNPRNWSFARRAATTGIVSGIGFVRYALLHHGSMRQGLVEVLSQVSQSGLA